MTKKIEKLTNEIGEISLRVDEIFKIVDIYDITDNENINSIKEELENYKKRIDEIRYEELK